jgi:hypothetical protein
VLEGIDLRFISDEVPTALTESQDGLQRVAEIVRALKEFSNPHEVPGRR